MKVSSLINEVRQRASKSIRIEGPMQDIAGTVKVQGSKNATNKLIALTVAVPGKYLLTNFPYILDPLEMLLMIEDMGGHVILDNGSATIDTTNITNHKIPRSRTKSTTGLFGLMGSLLGRFGSVDIGKPGGDDIGARPIGFHVEGLQQAGAKVQETDLEVTASINPVESAEINMPQTSVGATMNVALCLIGAGMNSVINNTPEEPEMDTFYDMARTIGVKVSKPCPNTVKIDASDLKPNKKDIEFACPPDRNDTFTLMSIGALSKKGIMITDCDVESMTPGIDTLKSLGVSITVVDGTSLSVKAPNESKDARIIAGMNKSFHSDWSPLISTFLSMRPAPTVVIDVLYSNRVRHAEILKDLGARLEILGGDPPADVKILFPASAMKSARYIMRYSGGSHLNAADITVGYDLRACVSSLISASQATGSSTLTNIGALQRGYEDIQQRFASIGIEFSYV